MLLIHDLAEAFTGDIPAPDKEKAREHYREQEQRWVAYIGLLGTHAGLADLRRVEQLWQEFEAGRSLNAQIAGDIDRLDNLVQLYVYEKRGDVIADAEDWKAWIFSRVQTDVGKRMLQLINQHFEPRPAQGPLPRTPPVPS